MIEDPLAEQLLLNRYEPGQTVVVDKDLEAGLDIRARREDAAPGERSSRTTRRPAELPAGCLFSGTLGACPGRAATSARAVRGLPALGGPVPELRRRGTASSRRSCATSPAQSRGAPPPVGRRTPAGAPRSLRRLRRRGSDRASARSTACSAAASSRARWSSSAASRGSASRRCCSSSQPASSMPPGSTCSTRAARNWPARCACGRPPRAARAAGRRAHARRRRDRGRPIVEIARGAPALLIVDSIQTATVEELDGPPGSVGQVRELALRLTELAKGDGIAVVLVGHVTKEGSLAGPKTLEHLVDAVLSLEGERAAGLRLLRGTKNRFGSTDEVGVFEMAERGLLEVADPARAFMGDLVEAAPGECRRARPSRAAGHCWSRSRRSSPRAAHAAARRRAGSTRTGSRC